MATKLTDKERFEKHTFIEEICSVVDIMNSVKALGCSTHITNTINGILYNIIEDAVERVKQLNGK